MSKKIDDGSLQTTKQMLDELDALMDRMLSLPVNDVEESPPHEKPAVLSAKLTLLESPPTPTFAAALTPPVVETPPLPVNPPHFTPPMSQPTLLTNEITPPSVMPQLEPLISDTAVEAPATSFSPLWWLNERFDAAVGWLPGIGTLLKSSNGRGFLGFLGFILSAAAFGWLLKDWLGWN
jgi:hypothetical protein